MATRRTSIHGQWSSRWAFILAATGSAVGLGNIWRFPYVTAENGGAAFIVLYLLCILFVGVPIMMSEIMLGRRGRQSPINTMTSLAAEEGQSKNWRILGIAGVLGGFFILTFYSIVGGWTLAYVFRAVSGIFTVSDAEEIGTIFNDLVSDPERLLAWHTIFMVMVVFVVSRGVKSGLEKAVRYLMPALFVMLLIMCGYALSTEGFADAMAYMLQPDFSNINHETVLIALGQAFFSLSLGMGAIMTYGSYLPKRVAIHRTTFTVAAMDTTVALLAGVAIFPIMFSYGLTPEEGGPGLIFKTLPIAFGQMPYGTLFGSIFFVLLLFAAWTSALSLLEPAVAWMVEKKRFTRMRATLYAGAVAWFLGLGSLLSLNLWSGMTFGGMTFFELVEFLSVNILLPLGGMFIAIFAAWAVSRKSSFDEFNMSELAYKCWQITVRYVAPIAVLLIFLEETIGIFE
ncbi:MAG: sodium-dependent transporter [Gammaproteobacteria bacterium]